MNGIELYQHIQQTYGYLAGRVIFITGDFLATDVQSFLSKCKCPHISKPFDIDMLKETISGMLAADNP